MLELVLVEHQEAAAGHRLEHFVYFGEGLALEGPVAATRIFEVASLASYLGNVHMDPFVAADSDHENALGAAFHEVDHAALPGVGGTFAGAGASVNDALVCAVEVEGAHAWGDRASAGGRTLDVDGGAEAVETIRLYHQVQNDACDAQAVPTVGVDLNWDHGDTQAPPTFRWEDQHLCCHYLVEILYFSHAGRHLSTVE